MRDCYRKIFFKIYTRDVMGYFRRKLNLGKNRIVVNSFLKQLEDSDKNLEYILELSKLCFENQNSLFFNACYDLVLNIVYSLEELTFVINFDEIDFKDIPLLIRITDVFGRFDLGFNLRSSYCKILENEATKSNAKWSVIVTYMLHLKLFGDVFFSRNQEIEKLTPPFYLRAFHKTIMARFDISNHNKDDLDFSDRIKNKSVAILAPGITSFDEKIIEDLNGFDEVVAITYTLNHYNDVPLKIYISYYNRDSLNILINQNASISDFNLDFYCIKDKQINKSGYRLVQTDAYQWTIGGPNMAQVALYDLLTFRPTRIKVFGMNFFLSTNTHHERYPSKVSLVGLSHHNIVSNYLYIFKLYNEGIIEVDDGANMILESGVNFYVEKMTKLYKMHFNSV